MFSFLMFQILVILSILTTTNSNFINSEKPKPKPNKHTSKFVNFGKILIFNICKDAIRSYVDKKKYHKYTHFSGLDVLIIRGIMNK
jgi:hypothetical protein